jgi:hypothetical protein
MAILLLLPMIVNTIIVFFSKKNLAIVRKKLNNIELKQVVFSVISKVGYAGVSLVNQHTYHQNNDVIWFLMFLYSHPTSVQHEIDYIYNVP